jgi:hypothetical protein
MACRSRDLPACAKHGFLISDSTRPRSSEKHWTVNRTSQLLLGLVQEPFIMQLPVRSSGVQIRMPRNAMPTRGAARRRPMPDITLCVGESSQGRRRESAVRGPSPSGRFEAEELSKIRLGANRFQATPSDEARSRFAFDRDVRTRRIEPTSIAKEPIGFAVRASGKVFAGSASRRSSHCGNSKRKGDNEPGILVVARESEFGLAAVARLKRNVGFALGSASAARHFARASGGEPVFAGEVCVQAPAPAAGIRDRTYPAPIASSVASRKR